MSSGLSRRLGRVTSSGEFLPEIDGLRFLAILPVVIHHAATYLLGLRGSLVPDWGHRYGLPFQIVGSFWIGVQLFFVISGFILARPFARYWLGFTRAPDLGAYYMRRATRIEPPYIISLIAAVFLLPAVGWTHYLASLLYVHVPVFGQATPVSVMWSLEMEVGFYVLALALE